MKGRSKFTIEITKFGLYKTRELDLINGRVRPRCRALWD